MKLFAFLVLIFRFFFRFLPYYSIQITHANLLVLRDVITRRKYARPAVLRIPLALTNPNAIFLLANLITMAPGTVCLDISPDKKFMYVHVMFYDGDGVRKDIKNLERRVGGLFS